MDVDREGFFGFDVVFDLFISDHVDIHNILDIFLDIVVVPMVVMIVINWLMPVIWTTLIRMPSIWISAFLISSFIGIALFVTCAQSGGAAFPAYRHSLVNRDVIDAARRNA